MFGEIEPLKKLRRDRSRASVVKRILNEYPTVEYPSGEVVYRLRKFPDRPDRPAEYDAPPPNLSGKGRLDELGRPVLYASKDIQVCIHECRVTAEDELYLATLRLNKPLRLLDLTAILREDCTEFESLDLAVHMLFLAGPHSYASSRAIIAAASEANFDGVLYPSYFSLLRTGAFPFETVYGLSLRRFEHLEDQEPSKIVPNVAIVGRPIEDGRVEVACINRLVLNRVQYEIGFGPVTF
jgi:hypothetical protein